MYCILNTVVQNIQLLYYLSNLSNEAKYFPLQYIFRIMGKIYFIFVSPKRPDLIRNTIIKGQHHY